MKVQDVMTETARFCRPENNLAEATAIMWEADCGFLPVVAEGGELIGVITDRDIAIALGTRDIRPSQIPVSAAMSSTVDTCSPADDIHTALKAMRRDQIRRLPVVNDEGLLMGIISMNDVVLQSQPITNHRASRLSYEDVVNTYKAICEHRHSPTEQETKEMRAAVD
jgi:CBS domain-containing protein